MRCPAVWQILGWTTHTEAGGDTTEGQGGVPAFIGFNAGNGTGEELQKVIWKSENLKFSKDGFYNQTMTFPPEGEYSAMFLQATFKSIYDYKFIATSETTIFPDKYPFEDCTGVACYGVLV